MLAIWLDKDFIRPPNTIFNSSFSKVIIKPDFLEPLGIIERAK